MHHISPTASWISNFFLGRVPLNVGRTVLPRPVFRRGYGGWNPPEKSTSGDVMNIIMTIIGLVGLQRAPECIKMHHFEEENAKIFLEREHSPVPRPYPTGEGDTPSPDPTLVLRRLHSSADPARPHFWIRAWRQGLYKQTCGIPNSSRCSSQLLPPWLEVTCGVKTS